MKDPQPLPRSPAEEVGIPSSAVSAFLDAIERSGQEVHSFLLARRGRVAAEAWWKPYAPELPHMLYSLSKSFTSTAVGIAVSDGLLSVDDPILRFFPEDAPRRPSANLEAMRVRHLLSMSTGHAQETMNGTRRGSSRNWVRSILSLPVEREPGTRFLYNSGASYLLSAIVQKVSGLRLLDYLTPRLLEPLGIRGATWERCPRGVDTGGWGLSVTTEDIAKFGLLYLRKGLWEGRRVIPETWVEEATRAQISTAERDSVDWAQGYGYQFWRCRHGAYRGDGAFGQFCVVMPAEDAVLAMTSGAANMQAILDAAWDTLLPSMGEEARVIKRHQASLRRALATRRLEPPAFRDDTAARAAVDGRSYRLEDNEARLRSISFSFARGKAVLKVRGRRTATYRCGAGRWAAGRACRPGGPDGSTGPVRAAYTWTAAGELEATVRRITTPFVETLTCRFDGEALELRQRVNVAFGPTEGPAVRGRHEHTAPGAVTPRPSPSRTGGTEA